MSKIHHVEGAREANFVIGVVWQFGRNPFDASCLAALDDLLVRQRISAAIRSGHGGVLCGSVAAHAVDEGVVLFVLGKCKRDLLRVELGLAQQFGIAWAVVSKCGA